MLKLEDQGTHAPETPVKLLQTPGLVFVRFFLGGC